MRVNTVRFFLLLLLLGLGCSSARESAYEDPSAYRRQVASLTERLIRNPEDAEALRELGIIHLRTNQPMRAYEYLTQAYARNATDPSTAYHLGLASELVGKREEAFKLYASYADVPSRSAFHDRLEGRYRWVARLVARDEMQRRLREETGPDRLQTSPRIVAVFPLTYTGDDARYAALSRGLAEMVSVDLAQIDELRVVERARLQALLEELALVETGAIDASTAPRGGRLLGAGRIVGGSYNVTAGRSILVDAGVMDLENTDTYAFESNALSDELKNLFRLQKDVVFSIVNQLGVELSAEQRGRIEKIPTSDLQAFLAFSRGLKEEDAGNLAGAQSQYERAATLDPGFSMARLKADQAQLTAEEQGTAEEIVQASIAGSESIDLVEDRLGMLGATVGAGILPGPDNREPAEEATASLPEPPLPPAQ